MNKFNTIQRSLGFFTALKLATVALASVCVFIGCANQVASAEPENDKQASDGSLTRTISNTEEKLAKTLDRQVQDKKQAEKDALAARKAAYLFVGGSLSVSGVRYAPVTDADFAKIEAKQKPFRLSVAHSEIADADLERIAQNPHIIKISLVDVPKLTDAAVEKLARLPNVKYISIRNAPQLKNPNFAALANCKSCSSLYLADCANLSQESLATLADCDGLKHLWFHGCPVSDATLTQLAKCKSLRNLNLTGCSELTDAGIAEIAKFSSLKSLLLQHLPELTDAGIAQLSAATNLQWLTLGVCPKLTEEGVDALRQKLPQTKIRFTR